MSASVSKLNPTRVNFLVDAVIFLGFLLAMDPRTTGIAIHEWLSIAFGAAIVTHLILHWKWIVSVTRRFLGQVAVQARLNYVLNVVFFIDMTLIIFTGLMISREALPGLGITLAEGGPWRRLHSLTADFGVLVLGLHVALHWKWIVDTFKRYIVKPLFSARAGAAKPHTEVQA